MLTHIKTPIKVALSIGINNYDFVSKLKNPLNDAIDIKTKLVELGYSVILSENKNRIDLLRDIIEFKEAAKEADSVVIFYAGHGVQSKGINYILPKDANPKNEEELDIFCIKLDRLIEQNSIQEYRTNILIFDSCRNNPFKRSWSRNLSYEGFTPIIAPSGTLIAFSTSPGKTASDGIGKNGLYTQALLTEITKPDLSIIQVFQNVRQKVLFYSKNQQLSWESTSLLGDFYFNPKSFNPSDSRVIFIKKIASIIDNIRFKLDKTEVEIIDESTEGGVIFSYSSENEVKHIEKQLFYGMGRNFEDIYFNKNKPIYYRITTHHYNVPMYTDEKLANDIGSDHFDEAKTIIDIEEYYIIDNKVIANNKIEGKSHKVKSNVISDTVIKQINKLIEQIKSKSGEF